MPLTAGDKLGPYEIIALIGKGGMGEVYRARDTRIGRDVAVKISSENFTERFEREARAIAALNHPNTCTLYDVGPNYLVMEFVEGETPQGPMPLATALDYARQIAAALEDAHDKGIVHRDLKPANIKITPDGRVKVLDFGLAKVMGPVAASGPRTENSPTLSMAATQAGVILGTAAYMAPEQARGLATDRRADIWSFGVVLYEMIAGKRPFQGEDLTETLASVVRDKPDLAAVPGEVRRLLERCLEKDPKKRLRDISGVALLLELQTAHREAKPAKWPWAVAAVAVLGLATLGAIHFRETPPPVQAVQFSLEAPADAVFVNQYGGYAASPDGRYVIVDARLSQGSTNMLWLRPLDSLTARALPGTEGGNMPTWSPDSKSIAFEANGKLKRIEITGGAALTLSDAPGSQVTQTGTWNREGVILFGGSEGLHRVSASGGGASLFTKVDAGKKEIGHGYPQFLPDGDRFLYYVESADLNVRGVYASSLKNPSQRQLIVRTSAKGVYVPPRGVFPGYLLYLQDQTLVAQRFDASSLKVEGDPVSVAEEIGLNPGNPMRSAFWASDAGLLIYFSSNPLAAKRPIVWVGRDGKQTEATPDDTLFSVSIAPGAERLALERVESGAAGGRSNRDIWIRELTRGVMTRLTFDPARDAIPAWSPDGKQVAFSSDREGGTSQIYVKDASGSGQEQRVTQGPNLKAVLDWTKDGKYLLYREQNPATDRDLMAVPLDGDRKPFPVVNTTFVESTGAVSPDGRWVAYASNDSGRYEIYIQAFPAPGVNGPKGRWQVSSGGGYEVKWKGDGKELYFESLDGKMMAAAIQTGPQGVHADTPRVLFSADFNTTSLHEFDVTPDGQRFLLMLRAKAQDSGEKLTVVSNWQAAMRK